MTMHDKIHPDDLTAEERAIVGSPGDLISEDAMGPRQPAASVMLSVRVDRQVVDRLSRLAESRGQTFSETVRDALRAFGDAGGAGGAAYAPVEPHGRESSRRVAETALRSWSDQELAQALGRYETECRQAGMRETSWRSYVDYARRFLAWRTGDYHPRGSAAGNRPVPRTPASTGELRDQAGRYAGDVQAAGREQPTVDTYHRHAMFFIRWLEGDFQPGRRLRGLG